MGEYQFQFPATKRRWAVRDELGKPLFTVHYDKKFPLIFHTQIDHQSYHICFMGPLTRKQKICWNETEIGQIHFKWNGIPELQLENVDNQVRTFRLKRRNPFKVKFDLVDEKKQLAIRIGDLSRISHGRGLTKYLQVKVNQNILRDMDIKEILFCTSHLIRIYVYSKNWHR